MRPCPCANCTKQNLLSPKRIFLDENGSKMLISPIGNDIGKIYCFSYNWEHSKVTILHISTAQTFLVPVLHFCCLLPWSELLCDLNFPVSLYKSIHSIGHQPHNRTLNHVVHTWPWECNVTTPPFSALSEYKLHLNNCKRIWWLKVRLIFRKIR